MPFVTKQSYHIQKAPVEVFQALTEPSGLNQWFLAKASLEKSAGGAFAFDWMQGYHMDGKVLEIKPPHSVAFLWRDPGSDGKIIETRVDFRLSPKDAGTQLELEHSGFTDPEHFAECSSRWAYYLMNLKSTLENKKDLRSPLDW